MELHDEVQGLYDEHGFSPLITALAALADAEGAPVTHTVLELLAKLVDRDDVDTEDGVLTEGEFLQTYAAEAQAREEERLKAPAIQFPPAPDVVAEVPVAATAPLPPAATHTLAPQPAPAVGADDASAILARLDFLAEFMHDIADRQSELTARLDASEVAAAAAPTGRGRAARKPKAPAASAPAAVSAAGRVVFD